MHDGRKLKANLRRLLSRGNEEERTAFLDKLSKFLLSADKKSKSKSNSPERTLTYTGEAFSALLSNENVLNNRPLLGMCNLHRVIRRRTQLT